MSSLARRRYRPEAYLPALLLIALILLIAWHRSGHQLNPGILDQGDYLHLGLMIAEGRALTDGARNPLYPAILATVATREHSYYASAKIVTLALGLVCYLFLAWRVARRWGPGMATAVLLVCGNSFVWTVTGLRVEVLMIPLVFLFWEAGTEGFRRGAAWLVAGGAAGLVYLTKANGTVLFAAFVLTWLLGGEWKTRRRWLLLLFVVPFAVVVSPLTLYNQAHFGAPFYNFNSNHAMWADTWEELWAVKTPMPTFETWWAGHGWQDITDRVLQGLQALPDWHWFLLFFAAVTAAFLRLRSDPESPEPDLERHGLTLATAIMGAHLVLLTWFSVIVSSVHHVIPLQPVAAVVILSEAALYIPERWRAWGTRVRPLFTALLAVLVLASLFVLDLHNLHKRPIATYPEIENWIRTGTERSVVYGPSSNFPTWLFRPDFQFLKVPSDVSLDELRVLMKEWETEFLLVDGEAVAKRPVLEVLVRKDPTRGLVEATSLQGFRVHRKEPATPQRWILFELTGG